MNYFKYAKDVETNYFQYKEPDADALKLQINAVKGDRSMIMFADEIKRSSPEVKVSAPTLSRACNVTGGKPVSFELLKAIAKIADESSGVTLETLAIANGMRARDISEESQKIETADVNRQRLSMAEQERKIAMIIQNEIVERQYSIIRLSNVHNGYSLHGYRLQSDRMFPRIYSFGISVSGMYPCSTWKFAINILTVPQGSSKLSVEAHIGHFINKYSSIFASDSFEWEKYEKEKYSFVFIDKTMYDLFIKRIQENRILVNGLMTVILINIDDGIIIEEKQLERYDGERAPSLFTMQNQVQDDNLDLFDMLDYNVFDEEVSE